MRGGNRPFRQIRIERARTDILGVGQLRSRKFLWPLARSETFRNEREAKKFARAKLIEAKNVSAGTLNPYLPKRTIASSHMLEWLEEPDEDDLA